MKKDRRGASAGSAPRNPDIPFLRSGHSNIRPPSSSASRRRQHGEEILAYGADKYRARVMPTRLNRVGATVGFGDVLTTFVCWSERARRGRYTGSKDEVAAESCRSDCQLSRIA